METSTRSVMNAICITNCGQTFEYSPIMFGAHRLKNIPKTCPRCNDLRQKRPAEATVRERKILAATSCCLVDLDVSKFTKKISMVGDSQFWKGTFKTVTKGTNSQNPSQMSRIEVYDHRDPYEKDRLKLNGKLARVQVSHVTHDAPITRTFIHHRYEINSGKNAGVEFERSYKFSDEVADAKGLRYLGTIEVSKTFSADFVYVDLYPTEGKIPNSRLVVTQDNVFLHEKDKDGLPVMINGQPKYHQQANTFGTVLPAWSLVWSGDFLSLYQTSLFSSIEDLYAVKDEENFDWLTKVVLAYDDVVFNMAKAGTLPPNAEKRWEKITKMRNQAAGTNHEEEAKTSLKLAIAALERLTGFDQESEGYE